MTRILSCTFLLALCFIGYSQTTIVTGKVTEVETGAPVPFATIVFTGTTEGALTDFEGNFTASTNLPVDSIQVSYVGYIKRVKPLKRGVSQTINFQLREDIKTLMEVIITPEENPAFAILRKVIKGKKKHDKRKLEAYDYESYTRTELSIDNISDAMRERKFMKKILQVMDSVDQIAGEDGKPILPVMTSEVISRFYYRKSPFAKHEDVIKTKVSGVGITDGTTTSQLIGSTYQEYNFYQNWLNIIGKEFASPIANSWKILYDYELVDSLYIGNSYCYQLEFFPKQEQDLAFKGTMWITKEEHALKQIDAFIPNTSNLNFLEKIKIQQELAPTEAGPWLPEKTRVIVDFKPLTPKTAGILAKFYVSNKDVIVNKPKDNRFYMNTVSLDPNARISNEEYWNNARHDSLTATELSVFAMIDTLNQIPTVRNIATAIKILGSGYIKTGPIDIGPYGTFFGNNDVEGVRPGIGARTNIDFSNQWTLGGYAGYGFDDERWKYNAYAYFLASRNPWTEFRYQQQREIDQIWLLNENVEPGSLFYTFSRFGSLTQPFLKEKYRFSMIRQLGQGLNTEISVKHEDLQPLFDFSYFIGENRSEVASDYSVSEATISTKYGKDEIFVISDNQRLSLGPIRFPVYQISYTYGSDQAGGDFEYHKLEFDFQKKQKIGFLGVSRLRIGAGYLFGDVPYSLLFSPIGNETFVYANFAFNQMEYFEFSSDRYVEFRYEHSFEGFVLNRIPLLRKLKWRLIASANGLMGGIRSENINISNFETDENGEVITPFREWKNRPYLEVGYGVENIFKFFSLQAFHRLTYLDEDASKFGLKFKVSLRL
ncbi:MAG: DUF5686 family protein [Bacteroidota bacterium]